MHIRAGLLAFPLAIALLAPAPASAERVGPGDPSLPLPPERAAATPQGPAPQPFRLLLDIGLVAGSALDLHAPGQSLPTELALQPAAAKADMQSAEGDSISWIGHATFLIRLGGVTVLTDPVFSRRLFSPLLGPARRTSLPLDVEDLPEIDAIVISHADYDHLDMPSLRRLARRFPDATVIVPLRNGDLLRRAGFRDVRELAWYQRVEVEGLAIHATPAYHSNRREPGNPLRRLWAGYSLNADGHRVFFSGDTDDGPAYEEVRRRIGRHEVTLVGIGGYAPRAAEAGYHATPEGAVRIARALGSRLAIGMHWGTFAVSPEPLMEPPRRFLDAGGGGVETTTMSIGETMPLFRGEVTKN